MKWRACDSEELKIQKQIYEIKAEEYTYYGLAEGEVVDDEELEDTEGDIEKMKNVKHDDDLDE